MNDEQRLHALAFNAISIGLGNSYVSLSQRQVVTDDVLGAVVPEVRRQVLEEVLDDLTWRLGKVGPMVAEGMFVAIGRLNEMLEEE